MATIGMGTRFGMLGLTALLAAGSFATETRAQGALDVDLEAAERALERTLALEGSLLLSPGQLEIVPSLRYDFTDIERLGSGERTRRDRLVGDVELRYGLSFDAQVEIGVPMIRVVERVDTLGGASTKETASGFGDFRLGFAKTLLRENGARPDLVGRITYNSKSGKDTDNGVTLTSNVEEVTFSLNAIKRFDPVALTGRIAYEKSFETDDNVDFGDTVSLGFAASLAASPTTSLSVGINASWGENAKVNGIEIANSNSNQASINFGVSQVLSRSTLGNINFGVGLTDDSPDYFLGISFATRMSRR